MHVVLYAWFICLIDISISQNDIIYTIHMRVVDIFVDTNLIARLYTNYNYILLEKNKNFELFKKMFGSNKFFGQGKSFRYRRYQVKMCSTINSCKLFILPNILSYRLWTRNITI